MNKIVILLSLFILSASISFSQDSTRGFRVNNNNPDSIADNYAIIVGISSYANINPLLYADDDAYLFADYLIKEKICEKKNVVRLIDSVATTANFYKELTRLKNKVKPNDRVFIYFAGHGDVETDLESGFLLTYNCEANNYPATAIDISMLEKYVNAFVNKKAKVVLITDACRSGNLAGGLSGASATMSSITKGFQNIIKILSCQPTQLSQEKDYPGGGHGVFTYHLVDGLSGMADTDGDSSISLREIDIYLDKVKAETNKNQSPKVDGDPEKNIAKFDEAIRLALLIKKKENTDVAVNSFKKIRGEEDSTWINNSYYKDFNEHIRKLRLIEPERNNAYFTITEAEKKKQPQALIEDMKLELAAVLEDEGQKWINKYLRGELEDQTSIVLDELMKVKKYLEVLKIIIDKKDLRFTEIHVKKIFFDAFYVLKKDTAQIKNSLKELVIANNLLPNQAWILNIIGSFYKNQKNYPEAEQAYKKAASLAPTWFYPLNNLGILYRELEKYTEAERAYKKAIELDSNVVYPFINLGHLYGYYLKNPAKAESAYKKAIQINPGYADSWYYLGNYYAGLKKFPEAEIAYKKALKLDSNCAYAWYYLVLLYRKFGKYSEGEITYKKALRLIPNFQYYFPDKKPEERSYR